MITERAENPARLHAARWATSVIFFLNGVGIGVWSAHIPLVRDRTGIDSRILGFVLLAMAGGAMVAMPLSGMLITRYGSRRVTIWAAFFFGVLIPLLVASTHMEGLFAAAIAFGAMNGALDVAMNAHAAEVETKRQRPTMSSFHGFFSIGGMAGAVLGALLIREGLGDGRGALGVGIATVISVLLAAPGLLPMSAGPTGIHQFAIPRRAALMLGFLALLCMAVEGALVDWSALLMRERTAAGLASAATGYSAFSFAMAACRFAGDQLVVKLGPRRVTILGGIFMCFGLLLSVWSNTYIGVCVGFVFIGLGAANVVPLIFGAAARLPRTSAGNGVATAATVGYAGFLFGPPIIGWIASRSSLAMALGYLSLAGAIIALSSKAVDPKSDER
jgi:MFS family permease